MWAWTRSPLLQGDLPGHVAAVGALDYGHWPLPWGWDFRFFCGAPVGTLYPPLFQWLGATIVELMPVGWYETARPYSGLPYPEEGVRILLFAYLLLLPPGLYSASRGLGLRRGEGYGRFIVDLPLPTGRELAGQLDHLRWGVGE